MSKKNKKHDFHEDKKEIEEIKEEVKEEIEKEKEETPEVEEKKRSHAALICMICVLLVALGYFVYKITSTNKSDEPKPEDGPNGSSHYTEVPDVDVPETGMVKDYDESHADIYYSYIYPIGNEQTAPWFIDHVYKTEKIAAENLTPEFTLFNAINNMCENGEANGNTKEFSVDALKSRIAQMYGATVESLPEYLMEYGGQSIYYELVDNKYVLSDKSGRSESCIHPKRDYTLFDHIESNDEYVFLYDRAIEKIKTYGAGATISKPDGSDEIETDIWKAKEAYDKYPEYFTSYVHVFKKENGNIKYIYSKPQNID